MTIFRQLLLLPLLFISTGYLSPKSVNPDNLFAHFDTRYSPSIHKTKNKTMGISINLYRLAKAEKLDDIKDLEYQISKTADTKVEKKFVGLNPARAGRIYSRTNVSFCAGELQSNLPEPK